ncbi:MAG: AAA family ATPase [Candidatus Binataceae bacterium]|nr:AAA family ATPase [Candidatus Binataceae bacterium]
MHGCEHNERICRVVPAEGEPEDVQEAIGAAIIAVELRSGSKTASVTAHARNSFKEILARFAAFGGIVRIIRRRGAIACWTDAGGGPEQAARAALAIRKLGLLGTALDKSSALNTALGVVLSAESNSTAQAFRLASLAQPGRVFFGQSAYLRIVDQFDFNGLNLNLSRMEGGFTVFELLGRKDERSGTAHVGLDRTPMVGRDEVAEQLDVALRLAANTAVVCRLIGEAGQGKSRLIREWLGGGDRSGVLDGWTRLGCSGVPYGDYAGRSWLRLIEPLGSGALDGGSSMPSVTEILDRLRKLGGQTLMVIDDVHWIDWQSRSRMSEMIGSLDRSLTILSYRPSFVQAEEMNSSMVEFRFRLTPLSNNEIKQLVEASPSYTGLNFPAGALREIVSRANGNPLYVSEAVEYLAAASAAARPLPRTLIELLILRADWIGDKVLSGLERDRASRLYSGATRENLLTEIAQIEERVSGWLDRFDVIEAASTVTVSVFLDRMRRIDGRLAILNILLGHQRAHRGRLSQGISRVERFTKYASGQT